MSTRANIKFEDEYDTYYVDRSHDGFPDNILADIKQTITECKGRWSGSELGQLVSYFLGRNFRQDARIQNYEICTSKAGDESYCYYVKWNEKSKEYNFGIIE